MGKVPKMIKVPAGSAYAQLEGGMGWLGFYVVSDGGTKHTACASMRQA